MDYYLYLQCLCYDRPRYMHEVYSNTKTVAEVDDYIQSSVRFGSFESLYFGRKSFYDTICLQLESLNISVFTIDHPLYPVRLHQLHDPPLALFCMGDIQLGSIQGLGMVGSAGIGAGRASGESVGCVGNGFGNYFRWGVGY